MQKGVRVSKMVDAISTLLLVAKSRKQQHKKRLQQA